MCGFVPSRKARHKIREKYSFDIKSKIESIENTLVGIKSTESILFGIVDILIHHSDFSILEVLMDRAKVPTEYRFMFHEMKKDDIFIDGGMNVGIVTDIALVKDATVYGFEPNPNAIKLLKNKFKNNKNVFIIEKALSNRNGESDFVLSSDYDQGANLFRVGNRKEILKVELVKFSEFVNSLNREIYMVKLDVEGAEFEIIEDLIESKSYTKIKYIVCETHARFFKDGDEKLKKITDLVNKNNINNIYLDWI
jgi:FkbM family methyltransferase